MHEQYRLQQDEEQRVSEQRVLVTQHVVWWSAAGIVLTLSVLFWLTLWGYRAEQRANQEAAARITEEQTRLALLTEPVQIVNDMHLGKTTVPRDGVLEVIFDTTRTEDCRVLVDSFIAEAATGAVVRATQSPGAISGVGEHLMATIHIQLPDYIGPGSYLFRAIIYNTDCVGTGRSFPVAVPARPFTVVER